MCIMPTHFQMHLRDKDQSLVQSFTDELIKVRSMFHASQKKPPLHKNMPPFVSRLLWIHALKERVRVRALCLQDSVIRHFPKGQRPKFVIKCSQSLASTYPAHVESQINQYIIWKVYAGVFGLYMLLLLIIA